MNEYDSLLKVAEKIKKSNKKVTLLYAFNATGKTRLSMEFKDLVNEYNEGMVTKRLFYYNAFTEDLFSWDNDLENDSQRVLKINVNSSFIKFIDEHGVGNQITKRFQEFSFSKIDPDINVNTGEITFSLSTGDNNSIKNIKISKSEESIFIWTVFFVLMEKIIEGQNIDEINDRSIDGFNQIKYIFIDDPVTSLDENYLIRLATSLKEVITNSNDLKFIITTHHALFYNVLFNEFKGKKDNKKVCYLLQKIENKYLLNKQDEDTPFAYHLLLKQVIQTAIDDNKIRKYHFILLRNLLEKTASFLGYNYWGDLLEIIYDKMTEADKRSYIRTINLFSHSKVSDTETVELKEREKNFLKELFNDFKEKFKWKD